MNHTNPTSRIAKNITTSRKRSSIPFQNRCEPQLSQFLNGKLQQHFLAINSYGFKHSKPLHELQFFIIFYVYKEDNLSIWNIQIDHIIRTSKNCVSQLSQQQCSKNGSFNGYKNTKLPSYTLRKSAIRSSLSHPWGMAFRRVQWGIDPNIHSVGKTMGSIIQIQWIIVEE